MVQKEPPIPACGFTFTRSVRALLAMTTGSGTYSDHCAGGREARGTVFVPETLRRLVVASSLRCSSAAAVAFASVVGGNAIAS